MNIHTWLQGFMVKSDLFCLDISLETGETKKTELSHEIWP